MNKKFKIEKGRIFNHRDGMSELKIFEDQLKEKDMSRRLDENGEWTDYDNLKDNAIVDDGDQAKLIPVELKDHSKDPVIASEVKVEASVVEKKKRGRPKKDTLKKEVKSVREFYCATCREKYLESTVMKIGAGQGRSAIFCPSCTKSLGFFQPDLDEKIDALIKNNPTK